MANSDNRTPSHLVFATDFSARCDRAQDRAVQLAVQWNAGLTAIHAIEDVAGVDGKSGRSRGNMACRNAEILRED